MMRLTPILLGIAAAAIVSWLLLGVGRSDVTSQDPETTVDVPDSPSRIRWFNVSVAAPTADSGIGVSRHLGMIGDPYPTLVISGRDEFGRETGERAEINAESGEVISDTFADRSGAGAVLLSSLEFGSDLPGVWPYVDVGAPPSDRTWENVMYPVPPASSGIVVMEGHGYCLDEPVCATVQLQYTNGRSDLLVDAADGTIVVSRITPEDQSAFGRIVESLQIRPHTPTTGN